MLVVIKILNWKFMFIMIIDDLSIGLVSSGSNKTICQISFESKFLLQHISSLKKIVMNTIHLIGKSIISTRFLLTLYNCEQIASIAFVCLKIDYKLSPKKIKKHLFTVNCHFRVLFNTNHWTNFIAKYLCTYSVWTVIVTFFWIAEFMNFFKLFLKIRA